METLRLFARAHIFAIILALASGLLIVAPHLLAQFSIGPSYQGFPYLQIDNEDYYLARVQEIFDGHGFVASPFFYEYKSALPLVLPTGELLFAALAAVTPLSLPHALVVAKFLFPILLYLLVYAFMLAALAKKDCTAKITANAAAALVVMGVGLIDYATLFTFLRGTLDHPLLSMWSRPVNPISGALFLFTSLYLVIRVKEKSYKFAAYIGVLLLLLSGYIFTFQIAGLILAFFFAHALYAKEYPRAQTLFLGGALGLFLIALYALSISHSLGGGGLERNGLLHIHTPFLNKIVLAATAITLVSWFFSQKKTPHATFVTPTILLFASFIALNQQIITGITIWPYHLVQYTTPLAICAIFLSLSAALSSAAPRTLSAISLSTITLSFLYALAAAHTFPLHLQDFKNDQKLMPLFTYLHNNAPKDCVVLSNESLPAHITDFIPGFTHCNIYSTKYLTTFVPEDRVLHNFLVDMRLKNPRDATEYLNSHKDDIVSSFYTSLDQLFQSSDTPQVAAQIPLLAKAYDGLNQVSLRDFIHIYRADYLLVSEPIATSTLTDLHAIKVFEQNSISLYSLPY